VNKVAALLFSLLFATTAAAQPIASIPADVTGVTLTASATLQVDNDRMTIHLQAQSEKPTAAAAASEVNAAMTKALATAKGVSAVTAKTLNYSTDQVMEKGRLVRWRVTQLLEIETADFTGRCESRHKASGRRPAPRLADVRRQPRGAAQGVGEIAARRARAMAGDREGSGHEHGLCGLHAGTPDGQCQRRRTPSAVRRPGDGGTRAGRVGCGFGGQQRDGDHRNR
jgi:hypothetical protein